MIPPIRLFALFLLLMTLAGCTGATFGEIQQPTVNPIPALTSSPIRISTPTPKAADEANWAIYHPDPQHLWNRLFRQLYRRTTREGKEYGWDTLDPLLWPETTHLLEGISYRQTIQLLDEYLSTNGEELITEPVKRAMFQRDLWAVFDWLALQPDSYPTQRQALQQRLVRVIKTLALSQQEILALPDNYAAAINAKAFPTDYLEGDPDVGFLPADLFKPEAGWVCFGRQGGPIAMTHTEAFPFFGRSVFLVFIRVPGGRKATLSYFQKLKPEHFPLLPAGTQVALIRRTFLIDEKGELTLSPIVESVQIRHFSSEAAQSFYEFKLNRALLFAGASGGLQPVESKLALFQAHGDWIQSGLRVEKAEIPDRCIACHIKGLGIDARSILSYSRQRFPLPEQQYPVLIETRPELEAQAVIAWKMEQENWQALQALWPEPDPLPAPKPFDLYDEQVVREVMTQWVAAYNAGDEQTFLAYLSDEYLAYGDCDYPEKRYYSFYDRASVRDWIRQRWLEDDHLQLRDIIVGDYGWQPGELIKVVGLDVHRTNRQLPKGTDIGIKVLFSDDGERGLISVLALASKVRCQKEDWLTWGEKVSDDPPDTCPVTQPPDSPFTPPPPYPPTSPSTDEFWYGTAALWTMLGIDGTWRRLPQQDTGYVQKIAWWREGYDILAEPQPNLTVTGRRLDAPAGPLRSSRATNAYLPYLKSAMLIGVTIPTLGCWEITGHYEGHDLSFVVWVAP